MLPSRQIRTHTLPRAIPGFIGEGHTAVHAIEPQGFVDHDPFIMLADDRLELPKGNRAGGPHPHAGFEIVTFLVEGELRDRDEGVMKAGDVAWMTAGSGVIHGEDVEPLGRSRILQLWVTLPSAVRWVEPRFALTTRDDAPLRTEPGFRARVYCGSSGSVTAQPHLYLPLTMVDVHLEAGATFEQMLPDTYNGFLYPLEGGAHVGGLSSAHLGVGEIGWLERSAAPGGTTLRLTAGPTGCRVMLYAAERQQVPIVSYGPFIGESRADLVRSSQAYSQGRMPRLSELRTR